MKPPRRPTPARTTGSGNRPASWPPRGVNPSRRVPENPQSIQMWFAAPSKDGQLLDLDCDVQRQHSPGEVARGSVVHGTAMGDLEVGIAEATAPGWR
jgi:hypothetical protein